MYLSDVKILALHVALLNREYLYYESCRTLMESIDKIANTRSQLNRLNRTYTKTITTTSLLLYENYVSFHRLLVPYADWLFFWSMSIWSRMSCSLPLTIWSPLTKSKHQVELSGQKAEIEDIASRIIDSLRYNLLYCGWRLLSTQPQPETAAQIETCLLGFRVSLWLTY